jgi:elongator complex protein 4
VPGRARVSHPSPAHPSAFCHVFDLTKKLDHPADANISFVKVSSHPERSPFSSVLEQLHNSLAEAPNNTIHRLVIPGLLSPQLFPPHASLPQHVLQFLQGIRVLLSAYPSRLVAMTTLPLCLFPRSTGLVRWMELLSDGVIELTPFPHSSDQDPLLPKASSGESTSNEEPPQGLLKVHRLPIFHERGGGTTAVGEDWAFTLSRRKFTIKPYSLPPIEGDTEAQQTGSAGQQPKKSDIEF